MGDDDTSIRVSRETWRRLHERKEPGVSHDEIISRLLDEADSSQVPAES